MTTLELERAARNVIPSTNATGWRITELGAAADGATIYAVVPIIDGRRDGKPVFSGNQRDTRRMHQLLTEDPSPRRARDIPAGVHGGRPSTEPDRALTEASDVRICPGCDQPLPADASPARLTHGGACRVAAFRRRADADSGAADVTPERRSDVVPALRSSARSAAATGVGSADGAEVRSAEGIDAPNPPYLPGARLERAAVDLEASASEPGSQLVASG